MFSFSKKKKKKEEEKSKLRLFFLKCVSVSLQKVLVLRLNPAGTMQVFCICRGLQRPEKKLAPLILRE